MGVVRRYEERLARIGEEVGKMHELAAEAVSLIPLLMKGDEGARSRAREIEREADVLGTDIDMECMHAVALFQPVARDLRYLLSMMRISSAYERITDLVQQVADLNPSPVPEVERAVETLGRMLERVRRGLGGETRGLREELTRLDDIVDTEYRRIVGRLKEKWGDSAVDTLLAARNVERIGDLLGKIGARILFIEEGRRVWIK